MISYKIPNGQYLISSHNDSSQSKRISRRSGGIRVVVCVCVCVGGAYQCHIVREFSL